LEDLVRTELLAREAKKRGYAEDPDLVAMFTQQTIARMVQKEFDPQFTPDKVTDADVKAHFEANANAFTRPEEVRVSQILVRDEKAAADIAAEAREIAPDLASFRKLVERYSMDHDSKRRGGDLGYFRRDDPRTPQDLSEIIFSTPDGQIAGPVRTAQGYRISQVTGRRPGLEPTMEEVAPRIRAELARQRRKKEMDAWLERLRGDHEVNIDEAALGAIQPAAGNPQTR
jgi:parvulin-like peptidyl-prolyl isomerase